MTLKHHHLIYQAKVGNSELGENSEEKLKEFFSNLLNEIGMECLIKPQLKLSKQKAWTGIMGIITSHIAFHFWTVERYVQLDIYSCKEFDKGKTVEFLNNFWKAKDVKALFLDRDTNEDFKVEKL